VKCDPNRLRGYGAVGGGNGPSPFGKWLIQQHVPTTVQAVTSCARDDTICLRPLKVDDIFVFIRHVAPVPACWLFKTSATSWPLTFWSWKWCLSHMWRGLPLCQF